MRMIEHAIKAIKNHPRDLFTVEYKANGETFKERNITASRFSQIIDHKDWELISFAS